MSPTYGEYVGLYGEEYLADWTDLMPCEVCNGDGEFEHVVGADPNGPVWRTTPCAACRGTGYELDDEGQPRWKVSGETVER